MILEREWEESQTAQTLREPGEQHPQVNVNEFFSFFN